jgi:hypothetical protein
MRTTEGKGLIRPTPVRVKLEDADIALAKFLTRKRLQFRQYAARQDEWGVGLCGTYRAVFTGFVCEIAFRLWVWREIGVWLELDTTPRVGGDGGVDFFLAGWGIQVKGATTDYDDLLVRTQDLCGPADGRLAAWDAIVRAHYPSRNDREASGGLFDVGTRFNYRAADLCGFVWEKRFLGLAVVEPARRGGHNNYAVRPERFQPMSDLSDMAQARLNLNRGNA